MDTRLIPRIQEVLQANKDKRVITLDSIVDELQTQYSEYRRKKKNAFRKAVEKAYDKVCSEIQGKKGGSFSKHERAHLEKRRKLTDTGYGDRSANSEDSFSEDNMDYAEYQDTNSVNSLMSTLYRKTPVENKQLSRLTNKSLSAPASPRRNFENTPVASPLRFSNDEDGLTYDSTLFVIDREGNKKINAQNGGLLDDNNVASTDKSRSPVKKSLKHGKDKKLNKERKAKSTDETPKVLETENVDTSDKKDKKNKKRIKGEDDFPVEKKAKKKKGPDVQESKVKFADVGGNDATLVEICKLLVHMKHPEVYKQLGVTPPRGFLLHGPPGCGKTLLAHAIAGELELPFIKMAATEVVSGVSGESEEKIRDVFDQAMSNSPCVLFLDEIDSITQKRETASKDMERRIVSQLLTCMDDLNNKDDVQVLVIGATNRPDSIDPGLRRAGRFDREISLGIPDENARKRILHVLCRDLRLAPDLGFDYLARMTPGYVGADLMSLAREAAITAVNRVFAALEKEQLTTSESIIPVTVSVPNPVVSESVHSVQETESQMETDIPHQETNSGAKSVEDKDNLEIVTKENNNKSDGMETDKTENVMKDSSVSQENGLLSILSWLKDRPPLTDDQLAGLFITENDFNVALSVVQPSAKREGFATVPDVTWSDIGALKEVREELQMAILAPVRHPEQFKALGLTNPPGILLAGPPGCGKTLLAKAVANESGINFISVKGPELLNMYVGESERAVRQVFQRARNSSPCVIFFDELDALCPRRSEGGEGGASVRVVNQLLTEMDGLETRKQVFIMGATNRPDIIDPAILRPGRLDKILYVGLPVMEDRWDILKTITKNGTKPDLAEDIDLKLVAREEKCNGFTGADLAALVREASVNALREYMSINQSEHKSIIVSHRHFEAAFKKVKPSVSAKDQKVYERIKERVGLT